MKRYFLILLFLAAFFETIKAQRTYLETEISKSVFKDFDISFSPQVRFNDGFELKQYLFDAGVEYKINKYFSLGTGYRIGTEIKTDGEKTNFGRFSLDAKAKVRWMQFEPKFRLRYSNENDDFGNISEIKGNFLRYKFELAYNFSGSGFQPYLYTEYFQNLTESGENGQRFEGGLDYKIDSHNKIGAYYRMNYGKNSCFEVIGLSYKLKL